MASKYKRKVAEANKESEKWFNAELKTIKKPKLPKTVKPSKPADSDSEDELGSNATFVPISSKKTKKATTPSSEPSTSEQEAGVVYLGHLPFGFEEYQVSEFFKQFGEIKRSFLAKSAKTGR